LEVLTGTPTAEYSYEGDWQCDPMGIDMGGYVDDALSPEGTWSLTPEE
jgi:hypothetical protein